MAHISLVHVILGDVSKSCHFGSSGISELWNFGTPGLRNSGNSKDFTLSHLKYSKHRSPKFLNLPGVHIVQLSTIKVVACGMSRKGPHHHKQHHHATPLLFFGFEALGFGALGYSTLAHPNSPERRTLEQADLLTHVSFCEWSE
jgi:hypothetical protein